MSDVNSVVGTAVLALLFAVVGGGFWALTMTRTVYQTSTLTGGDGPFIGIAFVIVPLLVGLPWPLGVPPSVAVVLVSVWFAWSSRVPFVFRAWSYHRLTGDAYYTITNPPPTVWKRPRFIQSWWPEWL